MSTARAQNSDTPAAKTVAGKSTLGDSGATKAAKPAKPAKPRVVRIYVIGDSLADGLWGGLYRHFIRQRHVKIIRETLNSSGLTAYDWQTRLNRVLAAGKPDMIVVQLGTNDHQRLIRRKRPLPGFMTPVWQREYRARVDRMMAAMKQAGVAAYWVGLPVMRRKRFNQNCQHLNDIYQQSAKAHGVQFVSLWGVTSGPAGEFVAFLRDEHGRQRRFRADDGIHFSQRGYSRLVAHLLTRVRATQPSLLPLTSAEKKAAAKKETAKKVGE